MPKKENVVCPYNRTQMKNLVKKMAGLCKNANTIGENKKVNNESGRVERKTLNVTNIT